jgi:hypothetical protein
MKPVHEVERQCDRDQRHDRAESDADGLHR